jgi:hypothetical protein
MCKSHQHVFLWPARALHAICLVTIHCRDLVVGRVGSRKGEASGGAALLHLHAAASLVQLPRPSYRCSLRTFSPQYEPATDLLFSDSSGTITFDEFKSVFAATLGADALPFNFDWYALLAGTE